MKATFKHNQAGVVLIIGLVMMLLLTIVGLAAIKSTSLQEMMAGNMKDSNMAFQSAEASLRAAERLISLQQVCTTGYPNANGCYTDQLLQVPPVNVAAWTANQWTANSIELQLKLNVSKQPRVVIEQVSSSIGSGTSSDDCIEMSLGCQTATSGTINVFRITSLGYGGTENSQVILQSTFKQKL